MIVTSYLRGGLGNQMFQIAKAYTEGVKNNINVVFRPTSFIPTEGNQPSKYLNNIFRNINFGRIDEKLLRFYEPSWSFNDSEIEYNTSIEHFGYFQSSKNFSGFEKEIKQLFSVTESFKNKIKTLYPKVFEKNTISIHIRRGDYLKIDEILPIVDKTYVDECLKQIEEKNFIFIFSNDKKWVRENLNYTNSIVVDGLEDYEELWMMSLCNHNIISNSSFSWWSAFLNENENKKVFAPSVWFGPKGEKNYQDIFEADWEIIETYYSDGKIKSSVYK